MGGKVSSKWRKYMETRMFLCLHAKKFTRKHKNMRVSMYLELTFTPITS